MNINFSKNKKKIPNFQYAVGIIANSLLRALLLLVPTWCPALIPMLLNTLKTQQKGTTKNCHKKL